MAPLCGRRVLPRSSHLESPQAASAVFWALLSLWLLLSHVALVSASSRGVVVSSAEAAPHVNNGLLHFDVPPQLDSATVYSRDAAALPGLTQLAQPQGMAARATAGDPSGSATNASWHMALQSSANRRLSGNANQLGSFQTVGLSDVVAVLAAIVPGTNLVFMAERPSGNHPDGNNKYVAGYYDLSTNRFTYVPTVDNVFCAGLTATADGNLAIIGGAAALDQWTNGLFALRIFDGKTRKLTTVGQMRHARWYPSATLLPQGTILIMGGTTRVSAGDPNNYYELWRPSFSKSLTTDVPMDMTYRTNAKQVYYPFNYVLPTGDLFSFCAKFGRIINPYSGEVKAVIPQLPGQYSSEYPYTGTSVLLPLMPHTNYAVRVVVFGGQDPRDRTAARPGLLASALSRQLTVSHSASGYSFSQWDQENSGGPRVMGDATLLPNGKVIILNGAKNGRAGDTGVAPNIQGLADEPAFYAYLFDPTAASGHKYTKLERSMIARMYHGTAGLNQDGNVVVTGCDRCWRFQSSLPYSPSTDAQTGALISAEYRVEIFYTPFWFSAVKPRITQSPQVIHYGAAFRVSYSGTVTGASLVASSTTTHSFNSHQRVVGLVVQSKANGVVTLVGPPNKNIAVPAMYLLFLLNGDAYSSGVWLFLNQA